MKTLITHGEKYIPLKPQNKLQQKKIKINDIQLSKGLAKGMIKPYYFIDRKLTTAFNIFIHSHHINHIKSKINNERKYWEFEKVYVIKIVKKSN